MTNQNTTIVVKVADIKANPNNPRIIKDDKFKKLVQSIKEFPKMLEIRPIVVNDDMVVLGGNMRLKACKEAGLKEIPIIKASDLTEEQQKEFIIKDNVGYGEWDWDIIANEWDLNNIQNWGLDIPTTFGNENNIMDQDDIEDDKYMAIVVVAYENVNDLDKITNLYELDSIDINENIKKQITMQRKVYVFKK